MSGSPRTKLNKPKKRTLKGPGCEPTITHEIIERLAELVKHGNYIETAYASLGIKKPTFYDWMTKGRLRRGTIYAALIDALDKAMAESEIIDVMGIARAAAGTKAEVLKEKDENGNDKVVFDDDGKPIIVRPAVKPDWKAHAWRLERRNPNRWGRSVIQLDGPLIASADSKKDDEETVALDPYSIKATLDKIRNEY